MQNGHGETASTNGAASPSASHPPAPAPLGAAVRRLPHLLTIDETADVLRVSRRAVERLLHAREIASVRIGRRVFVRADVIDGFVRACTLPALPDD